MSTLHQLFDITDQVAIVTGATKGIGLGVARALGVAGAKVVVSSRSEEAAKSTADRLSQEDGITAHGLEFDITDMDSVRRFAKDSQEVFGRADILVLNAAGLPPLGSILDQGPNELQDTVNKVLNGNLLLVNEILPHMIERKAGSIVFISSSVSHHGSKMLGLYSMAKAATDQLVRTLVAEIGPLNINVNSINPAAMKTEYSRGFWGNPEVEKRILSRIPMGRMAQPDDVAGLALLLASKAGRYISGQNILIDGGRSAV